jgi:hypothetical protein
MNDIYGKNIYISILQTRPSIKVTIVAPPLPISNIYKKKIFFILQTWPPKVTTIAPPLPISNIRSSISYSFGLSDLESMVEIDLMYKIVYNIKIVRSQMEG